MEETPIRSVEMVRAIRDAMYEETKHMSREEWSAYIARKTAETEEEARQRIRDGHPTSQPAV